jgi:hypothetical protein
MFGQKDDKSDEQTNNEATDSMQAVSDGAAQLLASDTPAPVDSDTAATSSDADWQHPGEPLDTNSDQIKDVISPAGGYPSSPNNRITPGGEATLPEPTLAFTPDSPTDDTSSGLVSDDDVSDAELIDIKQKALTELIPLIDKLDQPPQEKFRTIMMMIQASDDQRLVEKAYESAHAIEDEEVRAQALLDIVNEINYFTQPPAKEDAPAV